MSRDITPFGLRMPSDLKARVDAAAESNGRSINAECVARLQESFQTKVDASTLPVDVLLNAIIERLSTTTPNTPPIDIDALARALAPKLAEELGKQGPFKGRQT